MNGWSIGKLLDKYGECPKCGNEYINNGHGGLVIDNNTFRRFCKCGFDITVDENGIEVDVITCESCKYFLYAEDNHENYYCDYDEEYMFNIKICKSYDKYNEEKY